MHGLGMSYVVHLQVKVRKTATGKACHTVDALSQSNHTTSTLAVVTDVSADHRDDDATPRTEKLWLLQLWQTHQHPMQPYPQDTRSMSFLWDIFKISL